jgi:transcriptional regulator with XRE-family HTH domain
MRQSKGVSIRELERLTGINRGRLSMIERGIPPTPEELDVYFRALQRVVPPEVAHTS